MKKLILILFVFFSSCSQLPTIHSDLYWEKMVKSYSDSNQNSFMDFLRNSDEHVYNQILKDSSDKTLIEFWGQSLNFDSGAKAEILNKNIISDLQSSFNIKNDNVVVHAGIMHTYGYLFSVLNTPYGYKRKRWIEPTFDKGFNFTDASISPHPTSGTLLSNLTYFAGKIAFDEKQSQEKLEQLKNVSPSIKNYNYSALIVDVLVEDVTSHKEFPIIFKTHLVKLQNKDGNEENSYVLIYSIKDKLTKIEKLITAFPIKKDAYVKTLDPILLGEQRPILVRYNASIGTTQDTRLSGNRMILGVK